MRSMETLIDANHALSKDLPLAYLRRRHWLEAGNHLVEAATTGEDADIDLATEKLFFAIEHEGWMERPVLIPEASSLSDDDVPQEYIPPRRRTTAERPLDQPFPGDPLDQPFPGPRLRLLERVITESPTSEIRGEPAIGERWRVGAPHGDRTGLQEIIDHRAVAFRDHVAPQPQAVGGRKAGLIDIDLDRRPRRSIR
jgi:hypothetical protein